MASEVLKGILRKISKSEDNLILEANWAELKKYFPILVIFLILSFTVCTIAFFFMKVLIPPDKIFSDNKVNFLIALFLISPFAVFYAYIVYFNSYNKIFDEMKLRLSMINTLKKSEERYRRLFNNASDVILIHDLEGNIVEANRAACEKLQFSKNKFLTLKISDIEIRKNELHWQNNQEENEFNEKFLYETEFLNNDGIPIPFEMDSTVIEYKNSRNFMIIARDITERKKSERQLMLYQQQLKNMAAKLSLVQEEERRKIAVELHDYIGQNLAISKIKLQLALYENLEQPQIKEVLDLINQTIPFIRSLTTSLSPTILYDLSFKSALEWLCEDIQKNYKLDVELNYDDKKDLTLSNDVKIILFKSVRELLINSVKHSKVSKAFVSVDSADGYFKVLVEDKGVGFDVNKLFKTFNNDSGFGLFSTKERIEFIGGSFFAESEIGKYARISLMVPVQKS